ncbi:GNAT family N-acetyltransferase [Actinomadura madurae]|uniref:Predicted acetyltransferase n=1 Tax=Actinomadura madurae TaxID=1993 RepID=A0A1I5M9V4_9ACTN|nr:GNAT family N-acetyltransferase [Actinomadura madurae]SFP06372.1 Predicted acetyltransferase [Actinomadura madurae]SPT60950.1 Predicted acetyltransferase involved in intracellular survival and related acetyltransferases [Actinomadura madurae]
MDDPTTPICRPFDAGDERFVARLRNQCFSAPLDVDTWLENGHVLERDGAPVAALLARRCGQWFGGRPVPCVTVSSVMVDLTRRGGGVMADLLGPVLDRYAEAGAAIATLTPSSVAPYRRAGFEIAGFRYRHHVSPQALRRGQEKDGVRWFEAADADRLAEVYDTVARRGNGPIDRDRSWWHGHILPRVRSGETFAVVAERDGTATGYALWDQVPAPRGEFAFWHRVRAREIVWTSAPAARALLHALAQAGSPGEEISWFGGPSDGLAGFFDAPVLMDWVHPWMTKILDCPAALTSRGYNAGLDLTLVLGIQSAPDTEASTLRLAVRDGRCQVEETDAEPDVTVEATAFASLFTGRSSAREALALGHLKAHTSAAVDRMDAMFAATSPWFFEHF